MNFPRISFLGLDSFFKKDDKYSDFHTDRNGASSVSSQSSTSTNIPFSSTNKTPTMKTLMTLQNKNQASAFRPHYFVSPDEHHKELGQHVEVLWKHNDITDVIVKLNDVDYACHKTVLSCYSKYFNDLLLNAKSTVHVIEITVPSITNVAFEVILTYMYTSELHITCQNIGEVYTAGRKLVMDKVVSQCISILTGQTKSDVNSVYLYVMAWKQKLADRTKKALKVMMNKFEQIVGTPEFLDLDFPQVKTYLSQDVLATRSEVIVYLAALKWLSFKYMEREQYADELMGCIRFPMMTLKELLACYSPPLLPGLLEMKSIREKLLTATCYVAATTVSEEKRFQRYACRPRKYLLPREEVILWDPATSYENINPPSIKDKAAIAIQAAWRAYKDRKNIVDDSVEDIPQNKNETYDRWRSSFAGEPILRPSKPKSPRKTSLSDEVTASNPQKISPEEAPVTNNIDKRIIQAYQEKPIKKDSFLELEIFDLSKDKNDDSYPRKTRSGIRNKPKLSFLNNIRKSVATLMGNAASVVDKQHQGDKRQNNFENEDVPKPEQYYEQKKAGSDSLSSSDSLPNLIIRTDLKKYLCDSAQRSFSQPPETFHKIYTQAKPYEDLDKEDSIPTPDYVPREDLESSKNVEVFIIAAGGFRSDLWQGEEEGKGIYLFDVMREKWMKYGSLEEGRHHHCIILMDGAIYIIGGCNPDTTKKGRLIAENLCYKLETESGQWTTIAKMSHCRMYHGVTALKGKIFAVGGKDEQDRILGSIEVYDPKLNKWDFLASSLVTPMLGVGVCSHQRKLWIVGGMVQDDDGNINVIKDVNCFDPETERWIQNASPLPSARAFAAVVSFDGHIYAIGGTTQSGKLSDDQLTSMSDVLYYDEKENRWTYITPLPFPRHFVQPVVMGDKLYVMGGLTTFEKTAVDQVICYSRTTRSWSDSSAMPVPLCGFAAAKIPESLLN